MENGYFIFQLFWFRSLVLVSAYLSPDESSVGFHSAARFCAGLKYRYYFNLRDYGTDPFK
jgi:hypothetical protein